MKTKKLLHKILYVVAAFLLSLFVVFEYTLSKAVTASAERNTSTLRNTSIENDLQDIDTSLYANLPEDSPIQVVRFQEFCYSNIDWVNDMYGLYVYIYNPSKYALKKGNGYNKVNMAVEYDLNGSPKTYANLTLEYCDDSKGFYKFYILESGNLRSRVEDYMQKHGKRRYDIAGLQLTYINEDETDTQTKDRAYGYTYYFEGYAKECDVNNPDENTLKFSIENLETIKLVVNQTNYRTGDFVDNVCDELNTVYFTVADDIFETYGNLQKIEAEWYEYKTKPVFVTSDSYAEVPFKGIIGKHIGESDETFDWSVLWEVDTYNHSYDTLGGGRRAYKGFNKCSDLDWGLGDLYPMYYSDNAIFLPQIDWFFYKDGATKNSDYKVSKSEMMKYAKEYAIESDKFVGAYGEYSMNLFENSIDEDRLHLVQEHDKDATNGYVRQTIDVGDTGSLTVEKDQNLWDLFWKGVQYKEKGYDPIIVLDDLSALQAMSAEEFATEYLVNADEAKNIKAHCEGEIKNNGRVVLFRFAVTDYYASTAYFEKNGNGDMSSADGYVAQETVFLNFDVISLTFRSELGVGTVIPVVSNPLDIINGVDPSPDLGNEKDWPDWVYWIIGGLALLVVVVVLFLFGTYAKPVLDIIWFVIKLPFRAISWLFKSIGKLFSGKK